MPPKTTEADLQNSEEKRRSELFDYIRYFEAAFDELHKAVVTQATSEGNYIGPQHNYPQMSVLDSGFPSFRRYGFYDNNAPLNYTGVFRSSGLLAIFAGHLLPNAGFPKIEELADFLRKHDIGKRLGLSEPGYDGRLKNWPVDRLVGDAVERYIHLHGLDAPVETLRRKKVLMPLILGTVARSLRV